MPCPPGADLRHLCALLIHTHAPALLLEGISLKGSGCCSYLHTRPFDDLHTSSGVEYGCVTELEVTAASPGQAGGLLLLLLF